MASLSLSHAFQKSYREREQYPLNLVQRTLSCYPSALAGYARSLAQAAPDLFERSTEEIDLSFRDLGANYALEKRNIHSPDGLTAWLGTRWVPDPSDPNKLALVADKVDPKTRFIYIYGKHSRAYLRLTKEMFLEVLTFHQVMPDYLDFVSVFGRQSDPHDLMFSGFREQSDLKDVANGNASASLGRSGRQYQICFNLKGVTLKAEFPLDALNNDWSIRQAAFYHRFDVVEGRSLWIVTKGGTDLKDRYKELTSDGARPEDKAFGTVEECFKSSQSALLLFCYWSLEDWRGYIKWLENTIEGETIMALLGPRGEGQHHRIYTAMDMQLLLRWEERACEAISVLEANVEVLKSLKGFYLGLKASKEFPLRHSCANDIKLLANQLDGIINTFRMHISRAKPMVKLIIDRAALVREHLQTQQAERLERLNVNMENEAIVVRIITIVTLIYLPATFVSVILPTGGPQLLLILVQTFFSTDIIKYQGSEEGSFSYTAMIRWVQVTLPLTVLTLLAAWIGKKMPEWHIKRQGSFSIKANNWWQRNVKNAIRRRRSVSGTINLLPLPANSKQIGRSP